MKYSYTLTKKGQLTLPREVRERLGLKPLSRVSVFFDEEKQMVQLQPQRDIVDLAGTIKSKKPFDAEKLRDKFEKEYERR
jgi:AbrB family looped-hinge helix DNA binding protein